MSNVVLYTGRPSAFLRVETSIFVPPIPRFRGLSAFPSWIHYWPEVRNEFLGVDESNTGNISVTPYRCGYEDKEHPGFDLNPESLLRFVGHKRTIWNSTLTLGEVRKILGFVRHNSAGGALPGPLYFIVQGWGYCPYLMGIKRTNQYSFRIITCVEITADSQIPRRKLLFVPDKPR